MPWQQETSPGHYFNVRFGMSIFCPGIEALIRGGLLLFRKRLARFDQTLVACEEHSKHEHKQSGTDQRHSILTTSASGPNISIPMGIMEVEIIPKTPNIRPK